MDQRRFIQTRWIRQSEEQQPFRYKTRNMPEEHTIRSSWLISSNTFSRGTSTGGNIGSCSRARDGRCHYVDDSFAPIGSQKFRLRRHFSEDSGISSCGSSASSVADDLEILSVTKSCFRTRRIHSYQNTFSIFSGFQSDTVASVLAAGVSDSEETDECGSEEDNDSVFMDDRCTLSGAFSPQHCLSSGKESSLVSHTRNFYQNAATGCSSRVVWKEEVPPGSVGRDILDLAANLRTKFPLRATELPAKNLAQYLQNRSQYHRLGKFGTCDALNFAMCKNDCGFFFPIPPNDKARNR